METWYKINLRPIGSYFFGQELNAELGNKQNYYQRSALFPQQSTLLGMLRHQLLLSQGLASPVMVGASGNLVDIIGMKGFSPEKRNQEYGWIKEISPLFLQKNKKGYYFLNSREKVTIDGNSYQIVADGFIPYTDINGNYRQSVSLSCLSKDKIRKPYTNKYVFEESLVDIETGLFIPLDKVIHNVSQVGVYKHISRMETHSKTNKEAYIKRNFVQLGAKEAIPDTILSSKGQKERFSKLPLNEAFELAEEWSFAFFIESNSLEELLPSNQSRPIIMGKEQSGFLLDIEKINDGKFNSKNDNAWMFDSSPDDGTLCRVVLLNDTFIHELELLEKSSLIIGDTVRFRSFSRATNSLHKINFAKLNNNDKSDCYHLLKRGSVIYTTKAKSLCTDIKNHTNWRTIGYNYFQCHNI